MSLLVINSLEDIKAKVNAPGAKVILMASTTFCTPCKKVTPIFQQLAQDFSEKFTAIKTNLDEAPAVNDWLGVGSVPTFIYMRDGKEVYRVIGGCTKEDFISQINQFFG